MLSRKAYAVAADMGEQIDGGTAAYQRILGGLTIVFIPDVGDAASESQLRPATPGCRPPGTRAAATKWVIINGLAGPTVGVAAYQWALKTTPAGIVLPITATTPLLVIPFTYWFEGDRPGSQLSDGATRGAGRDRVDFDYGKDCQRPRPSSAMTPHCSL